jgi:hypothetical protein
MKISAIAWFLEENWIMMALRVAGSKTKAECVPVLKMGDTRSHGPLGATWCSGGSGL